jgi:hypothetical protein
VARLGVLVLTAGGSAVWYARQFEFAKVLQDTCGAEVSRRSPARASRSVGALLRRRMSVLAADLVRGPLHLHDLFDEEPDVVVVLASGVQDLQLLPEIRMPDGKPAVLCLFELWPQEIAEHRSLLKSSLRRFSHVNIGLGGALEECRQLLRKDVAPLFDGTDVLVQCSLGEQTGRLSGTAGLRVLSYGRVHPAQFQALRDGWLSGQIRYRFDSIGGWVCSVPLADHRRKLLEDLANTDFTVANCAKFDEPALTLLQRPQFGPRFVKAAAAGAIPIGEFSEAQLMEDMGLRGLSVPFVNSNQLVNRILSLPLSERSAIRQQNLLCALRQHDWAYRVDDLLSTIKEPAPEKLLARKDALAARALAVESEGAVPRL